MVLKFPLTLFKDNLCWHSSSKTCHYVKSTKTKHFNNMKCLKFSQEKKKTKQNFHKITELRRTLEVM